MNNIIKRIFDFVVSFIGLLFTWWIILIAWIIATIETKSNGFFIQNRVGRYGKLFKVIKIKTMKKVSGMDTTITSSDDVRITKSGKFFRNTKIDELPQLWNVLVGDMSFVGPRPDVPGYADNLQGDDRILLTIRPGITGPASLKYKNEEEILANQEDPINYNDNVIWPDKVKINIEYIKNWSLKKDIVYIIKTVTG
ncbi:sugar transferase [Sulfurimonas lithotrophica]|uniref:Sugar transferase n=1 Tax=Sulfurimonas lithotrophica TaxID=2590022 RepID=A0A5P8NZM5_9BACT|nr:sugar transferase [Sulfurimonas lithotrophica]QFR48902.1 sugar transferase [Sulfurimonas lithotrophica]